MKKPILSVDNSLYESELKVLEHLWNDGAMTAKDLAKKLEESTNWRKTTSYTVIKNCIEKGLIVRDEPYYICKPAITKTDVRKNETEIIIDKLFNGSTDTFVAFMLIKLLKQGDEVIIDSTSSMIRQNELTA